MLLRGDAGVRALAEVQRRRFTQPPADLRAVLREGQAVGAARRVGQKFPGLGTRRGVGAVEYGGEGRHVEGGGGDLALALVRDGERGARGAAETLFELGERSGEGGCVDPIGGHRRAERDEVAAVLGAEGSGDGFDGRKQGPQLGGGGRSRGVEPRGEREAGRGPEPRGRLDARAEGVELVGFEVAVRPGHPQQRKEGADLRVFEERRPGVRHRGARMWTSRAHRNAAKWRTDFSMEWAAQASFPRRAGSFFARNQSTNTRSFGGRFCRLG